LKRGRKDSQEKTDRQASIRFDAPLSKKDCRPWEAARFPMRPLGSLFCTANPLVCVHGGYL